MCLLLQVLKSPALEEYKMGGDHLMAQAHLYADEIKTGETLKEGQGMRLHRWHH